MLPVAVAVAVVVSIVSPGMAEDTYHQYNSRAWPLVILAFTAPQGMVDVNVTPDKKTVFLHQEDATTTKEKALFFSS